MASTYHLIVAIPDLEPVSYTINANVVTIGRSPENDIQIMVRELSTAHCELSGDEDGYEIVDKGSSNGTRVKGQGIRNGRVFLNHHDKIVFGETVPAYFVVAQDDERFSVKGTIAEIEAKEDEKIGAAAEMGETPGTDTPDPVTAAHATAAQAGDSTQILKKTPSLPPLGKPRAAAQKKKAPTLSKPGGNKPKIQALKKPGAAAEPAVAVPFKLKVEPKPVKDEVVEEVAKATPATPKAIMLRKQGAAKTSAKTSAKSAKKGSPKLNLPKKKE